MFLHKVTAESTLNIDLNDYFEKYCVLRFLDQKGPAIRSKQVFQVYQKFVLGIFLIFLHKITAA